MEKIKILFHSDFCLANTGFAKNAKNILSYLYNTNKYEIISYNCGMVQGDPNLLRTPWKSYGTMPSNKAELDNILNQHPPEHREPISRRIAYGEYYLDHIIQTEKPDVYIGVQDIWGVDYSVDKNWFKNIHSVIWTTLDSMPLLQTAVDMAPKIKNYWMWSNFAEKEMHRLGHKHVKTVHTGIDKNNFHRLEQYKKNELRQRFEIDKDTFVIGFVARNQLRKQFINLIEGFSIFKKNNPNIKAKLLFHTNWAEPGGWDIHKFANIYGVNIKDILTTYICKACRNYHIKDFTGHDTNCPLCKHEKSCITTGVQFGVNEHQLNEIYNLMDIYVHPFSSGGIEIPILEAKLAEIITCVTNYSCGEELCEDGSGTLPLEFSKYYEHGTNFIKATTSPSSIAKQIQKVFNMDDSKRREFSKIGREWAVKNFSTEIIGKIIEQFLDNLPKINYDNFKKEEVKIQNPQADINDILNHPDDEFFIREIYKRILNVTEPDIAGLNHWKGFLAQGNN